MEDYVPDQLSEKEEAILTFIAGYCAFKIARRINCECCKNAVKQNRKLHYEIDSGSEMALIVKLNRGALSFPTGFTRTICRYCYFVYSVLTKASNQDLFLKANDDHRRAVKVITMEVISKQLSALMEDSCPDCVVPNSNLAERLVSVCTNTLLNGFQRKKNDEISLKRQAKSDEANTRKLAKLKS